MSNVFQIKASNAAELVDDGSAAAFLQMNGQPMENILTKTIQERRDELVLLIRTAFKQLQDISTSSLDITELLQYFAILNEMSSIFQAMDTTRTYDIARVSCLSLTFSKYRI